MREFGTPLKDFDPDDMSERELYDSVRICGRDIDLYKPLPGQVAILFTGDGQIVANLRNVLNLLAAMMTTDDAKHVVHSMTIGALPEEDVADLGNIVIEFLRDDLAEESRFPTRRASASTSGPTRSGRSSTAGSRRVRSTPGPSRRAASSTSSTTT